MKLRRVIREGEYYPRGYGFAWLDYVRAEAVCYPIPLNVVMRAAYLLWVWCLLPFGVTKHERLRVENAGLRARLGVKP